MDTISITEISAADTHAVRQPVLRPGQPIESCLFDGDDLTTTKHFGVFVGSGLAGVLSLYNKPNAAFSVVNQCQLRGMAVLPEYQGQGLGARLIKHAESELLKTEYQLLWFNAREVAVPFYSKLGYRKSGEAFQIPRVGTH